MLRLEARGSWEVKLLCLLACGKKGEGKKEERDDGGLQMLTTRRDASLAITCFDDVVDEAGEWGNAADEESDDGAPVCGVLGRVAIDAMEVVHVGYGHVATSDDKVAAAWDIRISGRQRGKWEWCVGVWRRTQLSGLMS